MRRPPTDDYVREFVEEILRTGLLLVDLAAGLIETLPEDAYPGESNAEVVLDMMTGTIGPAAEAAGGPLPGWGGRQFSAPRNRTRPTSRRRCRPRSPPCRVRRTPRRQCRPYPRYRARRRCRARRRSPPRPRPRRRRRPPQARLFPRRR